MNCFENSSQMKNISNQEQRCVNAICDDIREKHFSANDGTRHHACFTSHGRGRHREILSTGKSIAIAQVNTPTLHAEIDAFGKLSKIARAHV